MNESNQHLSNCMNSWTGRIIGCFIADGKSALSIRPPTRSNLFSSRYGVNFKSFEFRGVGLASKSYSISSRKQSRWDTLIDTINASFNSDADKNRGSSQRDSLFRSSFLARKIQAMILFNLFRSDVFLKIELKGRSDWLVGRFVALSFTFNCDTSPVGVFENGIGQSLSERFKNCGPTNQRWPSLNWLGKIPLLQSSAEFKR